MGNYRALLVWRKSVDLAVDVYSATRKLPKDEVFGLRMQMRRAAVSVPLNIAEGQGRWTRNDYRRFVLNARGSLLELETQIVICERLHYIVEAECNRLRVQTREIGRMLNGLLKYLAPEA